MDTWHRGVPVFDNVTVVDSRNLDYFYRGSVPLSLPLVNNNPTPQPIPGGSSKVFIKGNAVWVDAGYVDNRSLTISIQGFPYPSKALAMAYISGVVTMDGEVVEGALLTCLVDETKEVIGTTYSDALGAYTFKVTPDRTYSIFVEYEIAGQKYRALSHWSIEAEEV